MNTQTRYSIKYSSDLDSMKKAYLTLDKEIIVSVKDYIYDNYDLSIADNIVMRAEYNTEEKGD